MCSICRPGIGPTNVAVGSPDGVFYHGHGVDARPEISSLKQGIAFYKPVPERPHHVATVAASSASSSSHNTAAAPEAQAQASSHAARDPSPAGSDVVLDVDNAGSGRIRRGNSMVHYPTLRVALVDDEPANQRIAVRFLKLLGVHQDNISTFPDGQCAIICFSRLAVSLITLPLAHCRCHRLGLHQQHPGIQLECFKREVACVTSAGWPTCTQSAL